MTTPTVRSAGSTIVDDESAIDPAELRDHVAPLARAVLAHALILGVAADLLLRSGFTGLGYPLWLTLLALGTLSLVWRAGRRIPREAAAWLLVAVAFGVGMAWRDEEGLQFLDFVATLFALGMTAIAIGDARAALLAARLRDTIWAGAAEIRSVAAGLVPLVVHDVSLPVAQRELQGRFRPIARAALIAVPLLVVFGSLLRDADPVFASLVALPELDIGAILSHVVVIGLFTWIVAGWARGALIADLTRRRAPEVLPFGLGMLDVTVALGTLNALFALYVATQFGWFFGGERFLQARTGLTAAEYARQGFFQMVWVVLLVVPLLVGTRAMLRPDRALERRHTALALPLIALLATMILSAMLRMRLYVQYYGLTTDRLYPLVLMGWLAVMLAWLALTVLRGAGRPFVAGAVMSGLATLVALHVTVPDVIVARVNLARARNADSAATPGLDIEHLARLGGDAVPLAIPAVLAPSRGAPGSAERVASDRARCNASMWLLRRTRWRAGDPLPDDGAAWRRWNGGAAEAQRVVRENTPALRAVTRATCVARPPRTGPAAGPATAPAGT